MIKIGKDREMTVEERELNELSDKIDALKAELDTLEVKYDDLGGYDRDDGQCVNYRISEITIFSDGDVETSCWGDDDDVDDLAEMLVLQTIVERINDKKMNAVPDEDEMKDLVSQVTKAVEKIVAKA